MNQRGIRKLSTLIVGIGSAHGDDRAGWLVVEQLREEAHRKGFDLRIAKSPVDLLDWLERDQQLVICDACHGPGRVGDLHRWSWPAPEIFQVSMSGTHNLSLTTVLALSEKLDKLPEEVVIWAIHGKKHASTSTLTPEVRDAIPRMASRIMSELSPT